MAKIIRDVDEQKIKEHTDDIDTILVFVRFMPLAINLPANMIFSGGSFLGSNDIFSPRIL